MTDEQVKGVTVLEHPMEEHPRPAVPRFYSDEEIVDLFGGEPDGLVMQLLKRAHKAEAANDKLPPLDLLGRYMDEYSDRLSNDGCNDEELDDTPANRKFWLTVCEAEGMGETDWMPEKPGQKIRAMNWIVATYLATMVREAAAIVKAEAAK